MNALGLASAAGLGFGLGVVTSVTPAVINVSIVEAAAAGRRRFAIGLGVGGATADAIQAGLAFAGIGSVVLARPELVRALTIAAALALVGFAVATWRRRPTARRGPLPDGGATAGLARGAATGFALTLLNPAVLAAWAAVAAAAWPHAASLEAAAIAAGVGTGSALWFTLLARWISRIRPDHPAVAAIPRVALVVLVGIAVAGVVRAL